MSKTNLGSVLFEPDANFDCPIHRSQECKPIYCFECFGCRQGVWVQFGNNFYCDVCQGNWLDWDKFEHSGLIKQIFCGNLV